MTGTEIRFLSETAWGIAGTWLDCGMDTEQLLPSVESSHELTQPQSAGPYFLSIDIISLSCVPHIQYLWEVITTEWGKKPWNNVLKIQNTVYKPVQDKGDSKPWHQGL